MSELPYTSQKIALPAEPEQQAQLEAIDAEEEQAQSDSYERDPAAHEIFLDDIRYRFDVQRY